MPEIWANLERRRVSFQIRKSDESYCKISWRKL